MLVTFEDSEYIYNGRRYFIDIAMHYFTYESCLVIQPIGELALLIGKDASEFGFYSPENKMCIPVKRIKRIDCGYDFSKEYSFELDMPAIEAIITKIQAGLDAIDA